MRTDGLVATVSGATLAKTDVDAKKQTPAGPVLVASDALDNRDVYRDVAVLVRGQIVAGTHERWREGTFRCLRAARSLAVLSAMCSAMALAARFVA